MNPKPVMQKPPHYMLDKIIRVSSWPLLVVVILFLGTGYVMSGQYGMGALMEAKTALSLHKMLHTLLVTLLLVHVVPATYLAFRRWGWIKKPDQT